MGQWMRSPANTSNVLRVLGGLVFAVVLLLAGRDLQASGRQVLSLGDRGDDVVKVQRELIKQDFYNGPASGFYGGETVRAVRAFQAKNDLKVSGLADKRTRLLLFRKGAVNPLDVSLLAALIESEAADEPYLGKLAVGAVILNRVGSAAFPNTLPAVIFQPGAFESVQNGQLGRPVSAESRRAAVDALEGKDPTGGSLYFWNPSKPVNPWVWQRRKVTKIGDHIFAR